MTRKDEEMTPMERKLMESVLDDAGRDVWDKAVELCAKVADADMAWGTAERIRSLSFARTPMKPREEGRG
jgi:hypothetical protein